jgi:hypothetical protein
MEKEVQTRQIGNKQVKKGTQTHMAMMTKQIMNKADKQQVRKSKQASKEGNNG